MRAPPPFRGPDVPTLALCAFAVALLVGYRIATGAGFGFMDTGSVAAVTGFMANPVDNLSYASFVTQAAHGHWLFADAYTLTPHREIYFNPYFMTLGLLARLTRLPSPAVMIMVGIAAMAVTIYAAFLVAIASGLDTAAARWAAVFAAFASGISGVLTLGSCVLGSHCDLVRGADLAYADAFFSASFYVYPYHAAANALVTLATAAAVPLLKDGPTPFSRRRILALVTLAATLAASHPYEIIMLLAAIGGSVAFAAATGRGALARRRFLTLGICAVGALPFAFYGAWVSSQPVWQEFANKSLSLSRSRLSWVWGYGVPGVLAVLGVVSSFRTRGPADLDWAASWIAALFLLLIVLAVPETKVCNGGYLPIAVAAGAGMDGLMRRLPPSAMVRGVAAGGALVLSVSSFIFLLLIVYRPQPLDMNLVRITGRISELKPRHATVLAPSDAGIVLPVLGDIHVYAGHWSLTDRYREKVRRLRAAGFERENAGEASASKRQASEITFAHLLRATRAGFVVTHRLRLATAVAERSPAVRIIECAESWCLFRSQP